MYNRDAINRLVAYIQNQNGVDDKEKLSSRVKKEFNLTQDRKVFIHRTLRSDLVNPRVSA